MSAPRVTIYTRQWCGFCSAALRLLEAEQIPFEHIDLTGDWQAMQEIRDRTGHPTMPQVLLDGALVGGYDELSHRVRVEGADAFR